MKINKLVILAPLALALAGCASDSKKIVDLNLQYVPSSAVTAGNNDPAAQAQLAQAASSVSGSLQKLDAVQLAAHPNAKMAKPLNARAIGMSQVTSVDWNGPVEPILNKIAAASGYQVRVLGQKPAIPTLVSVNANNETLASILRNVTYQIHTKADVVVYPKTKVIELRYINQ